MTMLLWHLQIRNLNLMFGELKDYFINQFCFSSRLTGLTSMMSFKKSSGVSVTAFCPQILVSKLLCFRNFAHAQKYVFREACRFYFDYFHVSVHSFIRNRKHYKIIISLGEWGLYHPPLPNLLFLLSWLYGQLHMEYERIS